MSLPEHPAQLSLFGVEHLLDHAFAPDDPYLLFQQRIYPLLLQARPALEKCYCPGNGRPGCEPVLLLGITLLQFMEKLPDRSAMAMLKYHLGWKLALQQPLEACAPDPSTLVHFRARLLEQGQATLLFDTILAALVEQGLVPKRGKRRLDSTQVLGQVAVLSEAEKLRETLRLALEHLQAQALVLPPWFAGLRERYVQSRPDWRMSKEAAGRYCQQAGEDLLRLRCWLAQEHPELRGSKPLELLERVYGESFALQENGTLLPKAKLPAGTLVNPHEEQAVMGRKREQQWTGYKLQVSESVPEAKAQPGEPTTGFLTAVHTQVASEGDIKGLEAIRQAEARAGLETPLQRYVDSAYVSGEQLRNEQERGGELMGPLSSEQHPAAIQGFVIAADGRSATCPAGHANEHCRRCAKRDRDTHYYRLVWKRCCQSCPRRQPCLGGKRQERYMETRAEYARIQQRRSEQKTELFRQQMQQRNGIEGSISELVRGHGLRRTRYRGLKKVHLGHLLLAAACNGKRWLKRLQYELRQQIRALAGEDRSGSGAMAA